MSLRGGQEEGQVGYKRRDSVSVRLKERVDDVQCKRKVSSFKTKKRLNTDPEDWVVVEDTHEAIIDHLDRTTAYQLIDHVLVHEHTKENGRIAQSIKVKYNFVGCLS